jgi:hypothetical protein
LLRNRSEQFPDYKREVFEQILRWHFQLERQLDLRGGMRTLYFCRPRTGIS